MKKCKECGKPRGHNNPLISLCRECTYKKSAENKKQTRIRIQSPKNKNTPAKFTQATKDIIKARDKVCIISGDVIEEYHHVFFGMQANRGENRNDANQGVGLSANIHRMIHHPSPKETSLAKLYRLKCIEYVTRL